MDGVVRVPSAFSMTFGVLPSMTDTHELVVPRSIPMIFPMFFLLYAGEPAGLQGLVRPDAGGRRGPPARLPRNLV